MTAFQLAPVPSPCCGAGLHYKEKGVLVCLECGREYYREKAWNELVEITTSDETAKS